MLKTLWLKMARVSTIAEVISKVVDISVGRALAHNLKAVNLSSVKSIKFTFNPFTENVESIRDVMFQLSVPKRRLSNPGCKMKPDVRSNRCDPEMFVTFENGQKAVFKTKALTTLDVILEFNKLCRLNEQRQ